MKTSTVDTSDGLEWLRAIRHELKREIGQTPKERAAYYQAKEKELRGRMMRSNRRGRKAAA